MSHSNLLALSSPSSPHRRSAVPVLWSEPGQGRSGTAYDDHTFRSPEDQTQAFVRTDQIPQSNCIIHTDSVHYLSTVLWSLQSISWSICVDLTQHWQQEGSCFTRPWNTARLLYLFISNKNLLEKSIFNNDWKSAKRKKYIFPWFKLL